MVNKNDSLGIPNYGPWYLEVNSKQNELEEFVKVNQFVVSVGQDDRIDIGDSKRVEFINYGKTQLVFVLTVDEDRQYTLLVNQPAVEFGTGEKEFINLSYLNNRYADVVVKPICYFAYEEENYELYVTPYYYQSRCIGVETTNWGMWVPEPSYYFKKFNREEQGMINSSIIATLIMLYDEDLELAIGKCRLDGGDFMLEKGFESRGYNYANILSNMKLIAARELINIGLSEYIDRLKKECLGEVEHYIFLAESLKCKMENDEVNKGIELGLKLRSEKGKYYCKK